jgi:hypothetical protein
MLILLNIGSCHYFISDLSEIADQLKIAVVNKSAQLS